MITVKGAVLNKSHKDIGARDITFMSPDIGVGDIGFTLIDGKSWQVRVISEEEYMQRNIGA